ncbi:hypothetical protein LPW11_07080 [Geomonas sp. RF6]|uniref:hypothetical protein n=1 Tax=Geomonas sp. RF6 TaxID=2897342 RepID=UPI001E524AFD|nr:hypothetical protein [Geomonas sp. RF6]UFS71947.1 hypothetical protein LPW11_07080 [Geomonas sp. RF6]
MSRPRLNAIFQQQIPGDHALLELAQRRFSEGGLGAEFYPDTPDHLRFLLRFRPHSPDEYTVHLPRHIDILNPAGRETVCAFAAVADASATGFVLHDQVEAATRFAEYTAAVRQLDAQLDRQAARPLIFIEYAAWLEPATFVALHEALRDVAGVGACVDIGHIGLFHCYRAFEEEHPGLRVAKLKAHTPELRIHVDRVQEACATALPGVLQVVASLGRLGKPMHFHLHDGHPSSTFSSVGVSDHLSFFQEVPIPFSYRGSHTLQMLFGPVGVHRVVMAARSFLPDERLSFTLEIHAPQGRQELGEYAPLFSHWGDTADAERMQYWIEVLLRNHRLLQGACEPAGERA